MKKQKETWDQYINKNGQLNSLSLSLANNICVNVIAYCRYDVSVHNRVGWRDDPNESLDRAGRWRHT
jgi:hypothetical protein